MDELHPDSKVIDRLMGPVAVAELCEVSSQAVSQWRRAGIPKARRMFLRLLRPDVFDRDAAPDDENEPADAPASHGAA